MCTLVSVEEQKTHARPIGCGGAAARCVSGDSSMVALLGHGQAARLVASLAKLPNIVHLARLANAMDMH